jgi:hypothetical protein
LVTRFSKKAFTSTPHSPSLRHPLISAASNRLKKGQKWRRDLLSYSPKSTGSLFSCPIKSSLLCMTSSTLPQGWSTCRTWSIPLATLVPYFRAA